MTSAKAVTHRPSYLQGVGMWADRALALIGKQVDHRREQRRRTDRISLFLGASAFVMSCLTYLCLQKPNDPITFLLFFILPVKLKPKFLLMGILGLEVYGFVFGELQNSSSIAHSAHLGGMMIGLLYSHPLFNFSGLI